jgi:protein-disulfide isomerase
MLSLKRLTIAGAICISISSFAQNDQVATSLEAEHLSPDLRAKIVQATQQMVNLGSGSRDVYVFSDPLCSHCRKLAVQLALIPNLRVHTFLLARQRGSRAVAESIWCAPDRELAWESLTQIESIPESASCDHPLLENAHLASEVGVVITPTFVTSDGRKFTGYRSRDSIEKILDVPKATAQVGKRKQTR